MSAWLPAFGTAQENFNQAQKWRGITHFGGVPGGQEPNFTKALHYYDACLRIEPAHEFAISHRAICLWDLARQHEAGTSRGSTRLLECSAWDWRRTSFPTTPIPFVAG